MSECPRPDIAVCYHRRDRSIGHGRERAGGQTPTDGREDAPDDARSGRASDGEAFLSRPADVPQRARIADSSNASAYFVSVREGQGPGRDLPLSIRVGEAITDVELRREDRRGDSCSLWCRHQFIQAGPRFARLPQSNPASSSGLERRLLGERVILSERRVQPVPRGLWTVGTF